MLNEEIFITEMLYKKHGRILLSKKECSAVVGRSISSLDRDRKNASGISYIQEDKANVYYAITDIALYVVNNKVQTTSLNLFSN